MKSNFSESKISYKTIHFLQFNQFILKCIILSWIYVTFFSFRKEIKKSFMLLFKKHSLQKTCQTKFILIKTSRNFQKVQINQNFKQKGLQKTKKLSRFEKLSNQNFIFDQNLQSKRKRSKLIKKSKQEKHGSNAFQKL